MGKEENITEDEAALYDRQIRLWGLDAQRRLRAARVLLVGLRGLGAEVAKNIVLSGIKSLTLLDHSLVNEEDSMSQFLVSKADIGKYRAESSVHKVQLLNPMVTVTADKEDVSEKDDTFFENFDVVCVTCCPPSTLCRIDNICSEKDILFFCGDVFGYYGYLFSDLGEHEYSEEVPNHKAKTADKDAEPPSPKKAKTEEPETVVVKKVMTFPRLEDALKTDWSAADMLKKLRKTPNTYFITQVCLDFYEKHKRHPLLKSKADDLKELELARDSTLKRLKVDKHLTLPEDFARCCFGELSPVCAIVGGVLGQEIIKAVSQKDPPHNHFFFYNGTDGNGIVDYITS